MLFDETLFELLHIDVVFKKKLCLTVQKCFEMMKIGIFSTSTQIPESVYKNVPGHNILGVSKVNAKAIK